MDNPALDIRITRANFSWNTANNLEPDDIALRDVELSIPRGSLVLIVGRVGSKI